MKIPQEVGKPNMSALLARRIPKVQRTTAAQDPLLHTIQLELKRSMKGLGGKGRPKPYFMSLWVQQHEERFVEVVSGAVVHEHPEDHPKRYAAVDVRIGSYAMDSSNLSFEVDTQENPEDDFGPEGWKLTRVPVENDPQAVRAALWLLTDLSYKRALRDYQRKTAERALSVRGEGLDDFTREAPITAVRPIPHMDIDLDAWRERARRVTRWLARDARIYSPTCWIQASRVINYFANSEGTLLRTASTSYTITLHAYSRAEDGEPVESFRFYFTRDAAELPGEPALTREARVLAQEITALRKAPTLAPFSGPALLDPGVAGVLFHEALGHRLEGERQRDPRSGQTFKGKIGQKVLPDFLTVIDDPTLHHVNGRSLVGAYEFDDQGVTGRRTVLVENGRLKNYLLSRTPVHGFNASNGHARAESPYQVSMHVPSGPRARMAVLKVTSANRSPRSRMKQALMEEARRQGKPFGLILKMAQGGDTDTYGGNYQAYRTTPGLIYRVDAETGKETLVRGVEIVGTPLVSLEKIIAMGDEPDGECVWNASCGAETGWVPVSTIAPSILTAQVELQRIATRAEREPHMPSPYSEE